MNKDTAEVTKIWEKHFGKNPSVALSQTEAFFNELAEYERTQDSKKISSNLPVSKSYYCEQQATGNERCVMQCQMCVNKFNKGTKQ